MTIQAGASRSLQELKDAHDRGMGIFLSFVIYALKPKLDPTTLANDFALGRATANPAVGRVIGTVGCWGQTERKSIPQGRRLVGTSVISNSHGGFRLNPVIVNVDSSKHLITLDLLNAVPEVDQSFEKADFGPAELALIDVSTPGSAPLTIGPVPYDRPHYEARSGLVDLDMPNTISSLIGNHALALIQSATGNVLMFEQEFTVETDERCLYLEEGETKSIELFLQQRGATPTSPTRVDLRQLVTSNRTQTPATLSNAIVSLASHVDFPGTSTASLAISGVRPGTCIITMLPPGEPASSRQYFINIRVLPKDDFSHIPDNEVTFELVYEKVLRYYHLLFPAMTQFLDLSDQSAMIDSAQFVIDRTNPAMFGKSSYMPVSRDMSAGKRELLRRWCQRTLDGV